ncbi:NADP-dependent oxidoreductase [Paenibacillus sp. Y412MC10]|uniref:NADP-dependent oxidoreductase n=1 Tax=Geobacillus sp. (strain Y412MC10) TaxID=481743 RepID=UPI0011AB448D|nr:NADP-dependent oxidoreductase [Paenibacillus sp. Y412MC10]
MKGIGIAEYGDISKLKIVEVPDHELNPDEVRIAIRASGVNPVDWKIREGFLKQSFSYDFPLILGWDAAGKIIEVGDNVSSLRVGDDVYFRPEIEKQGTYADEINVPERFVSLMPEGLTYAEAAALPLVSLTAYQALVEFGQVIEGQKVLLLGGSGGIGTTAIQIAKVLGAHVTTTTSTTNIDFVRSLGADEVIPYDQPLTIDYQDHFDFVLDPVGGRAYMDAIAWLKPYGKLATIFGGPDDPRPVLPLAGEKKLIIEYVFTRPDAANLNQIAKLVEMGKLKPIVSEMYPLSVEGVQSAHLSNQSGRTRGKIVLVNN